MKSNKKSIFSPRNKVASATILRKAGPHGKTNKALRKAAKQSLQSNMDMSGGFFNQLHCHFG